MPSKEKTDALLQKLRKQDPGRRSLLPNLRKTTPNPNPTHTRKIGRKIYRIAVDLVILSIILAPVNFSMTWSGY